MRTDREGPPTGTESRELRRAFKVFFDKADPGLSLGAKDTLSQFAEELKRVDEPKASIYGSADQQGTLKANEQLAYLRAEAVAAFPQGQIAIPRCLHRLDTRVRPTAIGAIQPDRTCEGELAMPLSLPALCCRNGAAIPSYINCVRRYRHRYRAWRCKGCAIFPRQNAIFRDRARTPGDRARHLSAYALWPSEAHYL